MNFEFRGDSGPKVGWSFCHFLIGRQLETFLTDQILSKILKIGAIFGMIFIGGETENVSLREICQFWDQIPPQI